MKNKFHLKGKTLDSLYLRYGLLHQLPEGVAGVLAPDVLHQLGNALSVCLGFKNISFGFQEHLDVLRAFLL